MKYHTLNYQITQPYLFNGVIENISRDIVDLIIDRRGFSVGIVVHIALPHALFVEIHQTIVQKWTGDSDLMAIIMRHSVDFRIIDIARIHTGFNLKFDNGLPYELNRHG